MMNSAPLLNKFANDPISYYVKLANQLLTFSFFGGNSDFKIVFCTFTSL